MPRIDIGAVLADKAPRLARWIPGFVIGWLRRTIHESEINYILEHYWNLPPQEFIRACFREWQVTYTVEGLEKLDPKGRYLFAANHPFGGMDGMMLADKLIDRFGDARVVVNDLLMQSYQRRDEAWVGKMRYRGIVWSCPAHYYANFSNWLANCWGINILVEMESLNFTKPLETEDKEEALRDLARLYERMVMRRHTNGGYQNVVDELWRQCEAWNTNIIIMYQNVACKNMATVQGILDEQGRERGYHMIWIEHDLMDPRTVSRKTMRDKVNEYMRTVMRAEPIDPSLCDFDDENCM